MIDTIYPVGCYFETTDTTFNPNTTFGGTWVLEDEGLVHISSGTDYSVSNVSKDGGTTTNTITYNHLPNRVVGSFSNRTGSAKNISNTGWASSSWANGAYNATCIYDAYSVGIGTEQGLSTGGGVPINNMQPYKIVNRWHRTA